MPGRKYRIGILLFLLFVFLLAMMPARAQKTMLIHPKDSLRSIYKHNYLKFSYLNLLEIEPSVQLGYEYNAGKHFRIQHELGYLTLFNPLYGIFTDNETMDGLTSSGFRIRTTVKYPFVLDLKIDGNKYRYFGIDLMLKYLRVTQADVAVEQMGGAYWQRKDVTTRKYVAAIHFLYGTNKYLSYSKNIISGWYFGLGLRYKFIDGNTSEDNFDVILPPWDEISGLSLSIMVGSKLGFGI